MKMTWKILLDCRSSVTGCLTRLNYELLDSGFRLVAKVADCVNPFVGPGIFHVKEVPVHVIFQHFLQNTECMHYFMLSCNIWPKICKFSSICLKMRLKPKLFVSCTKLCIQGFQNVAIEVVFFFFITANSVMYPLILWYSVVTDTPPPIL